jgi:hypothetical protein
VQAEIARLPVSAAIDAQISAVMEPAGHALQDLAASGDAVKR